MKRILTIVFVMVSRYLHQKDYLQALAWSDYVTNEATHLALHIKVYKAMGKWDLAFAQQDSGLRP